MVRAAPVKDEPRTPERPQDLALPIANLGDPRGVLAAVERTLERLERAPAGDERTLEPEPIRRLVAMRLESQHPCLERRIARAARNRPRIGKALVGDGERLGDGAPEVLDPSPALLPGPRRAG